MLWELMRSCWNFNPDDRPDFQEIIQTLKNYCADTFGLFDLNSTSVRTSVARHPFSPSSKSEQSVSVATENTEYSTTPRDSKPDDYSLTKKKSSESLYALAPEKRLGKASAAPTPSISVQEGVHGYESASAVMEEGKK